MVSYLSHSDWRAWLPTRLIEIGFCASFALFFFWPIPPFSWLFLGVALVLAWMRLEIAVALLPLTLPYYLDIKPLTSHTFPSFSLSELGLVICLGIALLRTALFSRDRQATLEWVRRLWKQTHPFLLPALLFLLGASLSLLVSPDKHVSLRAYREMVVEPLLYGLLLLRYLRTRADIARTVAALVLSGLVLAFFGIVQGVFHLTSFLEIVNTTIFRVKGPTGSSNNLAFDLDRVLPILLALAFTHVLRRRRAPDSSQRSAWREPLRWACVLVMIPILWALYWTDSRGAEAGILVALVLFFILEVRRWIIVLPVLGVGVLGGGFYALHHNILSEAGHGTVSERMLLWKSALLIIRDHPFLGTGLGSFTYLYNPTSPQSYALKALDGQPFPPDYNPLLSHPHNMILDFWISTGVLGVVALLWILGVFVRTVIRTYRLAAPLRQGDLLQRLVLGITGSMLVGVVHGMVDNSYFLPDLAMLFWFFIGILLVIRSLARQERPSLRRSVTPQEPALAPLMEDRELLDPAPLGEEAL